MREFLLTLYLKHGEREFEHEIIIWSPLYRAGFLEINTMSGRTVTKITPKGLEYLKNLDNP